VIYYCFHDGSAFFPYAFKRLGRFFSSSGFAPQPYLYHGRLLAHHAHNLKAGIVSLPHGTRLKEWRFVEAVNCVLLSSIPGPIYSFTVIGFFFSPLQDAKSHLMGFSTFFEL